jgi:branched-chain amino acid transport system substrate-binding protein
MLARFAGTQWKGKSMAVLINIQEGAGPAHSALATVFARDFRKNGHTVGEWTFQNAAELKELAGRVGTAKPDALLVAGTVDDLMDLRRAGLAETMPVVLGTAEGVLSVLQARPLKNPVYLATAFVVEGGPAPAQEFARKYQDRFHEAADVHAALAYDGVRLVVEGFRRANSVEGEKVRTALAELKSFDSVTGPLTLDADHWAPRALFIVEVDKGQTKTVQAYDPEN